MPFEKVGNETSKAKHSKTSLVTSDKHSSDNICLSCYRSFKSKGGLTRHTKICKMISKVKESSDSENTTLMSVTEVDDEQPNVQLVLVFETDTNDADSDVYRKTNIQEQFFWGEKKGSDFTNSLKEVYERLIFWRKNLFLLPSGSSGKRFILETTRLYTLLDRRYTGERNRF